MAAPGGVAFEHIPGLGSDEYPGFPADECPAEMPDLSKHHSLAASVLRKDPGLYELLRTKRTELGTGLAKCIKTGMDNRGHPMIKTLGAVAGDEFCYETFRPLFDALLLDRHGASACEKPHSECRGRGGMSALDMLSAIPVDMAGKYVLSTQVRAARSLRGIRFPPTAVAEERCEVERVVVRALAELEGDLQGDYFPLAGSQSFSPRLGGMGPEDEAALSKAGLLFTHPDSTAALCTGMGRDWPHARGIFTNADHSLSVWINEEEHIRAVAVRANGDVQGAFGDIIKTLDHIALSLDRHSDGPKGFAQSDRLGYLTSCPSNLGTALRVSAIVCLPLLAQHESLSAWCSRRRLSIRAAVDADGARLQGVLEVSNQDRLGISEAATVNAVVEAVAELVMAEKRLEEGGMSGLQEDGSVKQEEAQEGEKEKAEAAAKQEPVDIPVEPPAAEPPAVAEPTPPAPSPVPEPPAAPAPPLAVAPQPAEATAVSASGGGARSSTEAEGAELICEADDNGESMWDVAAVTLTQLFSHATEREQAFAQARSRASGLLTGALHTGELEAAVKQMFAAEESTAIAAAATPEQEVKEKAKGLLTTALHSGELETRVREVWSNEQSAGASVENPAAIAPKVEVSQELKAKVANLLFQAATSGALGQALAELPRAEAGTPQAQDMVEPAPAKAEEVATAVPATAPPMTSEPATGTEEADLEEARVKMLGLLTSSLENDSLGRLLGDPAEPPSTTATATPASAGDAATTAAASTATSTAAAPANIEAPATKAETVSLEEMRSRMARILEESVENGTLEAILTATCGRGAPPPSEEATTGKAANVDVEVVNDLRAQVRRGLEDSFKSGKLESFLQSGGLHAAAPDDSAAPASGLAAAAAPPPQPQPPPPPPPPTAAAPAAAAAVPPGAGTAASLAAAAASGASVVENLAGAAPGLKALLLALSGNDRRIGTLTATIQVTERNLEEQEACAVKLESEIQAARAELAIVEEEIARTRLRVDEQEEFHVRLQENQRKLVDDFDTKNFQQAHAIVDIEQDYLISARSELSTACTVQDYSPRPLTSLPCAAGADSCSPAASRGDCMAPALPPSEAKNLLPLQSGAELAPLLVNGGASC